MLRRRLLLAVTSSVVILLGCPTQEPELMVEAPSTGCTVTSGGETVDGSSLWTDIPDASDPVNCNFHRFAYNNFLYLAGDDGSGHPRFMSLLAPWDDLFPASGKPTWPGGYSPLEAIESVKSDTTTLAELESGQAGDDFELVDVAGQTAQYDIRVNQAFFDYVSGAGAYTKTALSTAVSNFSNNAPTGGLWLPTGSSSEVGAIETKTSWRAFGSNSAACPTNIMHCEQDTDGNWWGLTGFHLVQKTPTRGELIWGSFEHVANSPDCGSGGTNPIQQDPQDPTNPSGTINANQNISSVESQTGWNFFNYSTYKSGGGDGTTCSFPEDASAPADTQCNSDPIDGSGFKQVNVCRTDQLPPASTSCSSTTDNGSNVSCLNASVLANFPSGLDAKWKYYMHIGTEWVNATSVPTTGCFVFNTGFPKCPSAPAGTTYPGTNTPYPATFTPTGSINLANTTMETWMQKEMAGLYGPDKKKFSATDCFGCHQAVTATFGEGDTSHVFTKIQQQ